MDAEALSLAKLPNNSRKQFVQIFFWDQHILVYTIKYNSCSWINFRMVGGGPGKPPQGGGKGRKLIGWGWTRVARPLMQIRLLHLNIFEILFGRGGPLLGEAPSQKVIGWGWGELARPLLRTKLLHLDIFEISFGPGGPLLGKAPSQKVIGWGWGQLARPLLQRL